MIYFVSWISEDEAVCIEETWVTVILKPLLLVVMKFAQSVADVYWYFPLLACLGVSDQDICNQAPDSSE